MTVLDSLENNSELIGGGGLSEVECSIVRAVPHLRQLAIISSKIEQYALWGAPGALLWAEQSVMALIIAL